jgi:Gpi18-like mannosyltransferase
LTVVALRKDSQPVHLPQPAPAAEAEPQPVPTEPEPAPPADIEKIDDRPWRRSLRTAGLLWVASHLGYVVLTFFAFFQSNRPVPTIGAAFGKWFVNWDAVWFVWIADHGYRFSYASKEISEERSAAFFPLYPLLIKIVSFVTVSSFAAAFLIAAAAQLGAFTVLHRLTETEIGRRTADRTVLYLLVFPTGFFLGISYNASLFLFLAVSSVYLMRRGTWWAAAALAGLATATRSSALLLVIPFAYEYLRQREFQLRRIRWDAAWVAVIPTGIIAFALFCWYDFGDPLRFVHAQALWFRERDWPWVGIYQTVRILFSTKNIIGNDVRNFMDLGAVVFVSTLLVLAFVGPWKLRPDQRFLALYGVASVLFIISFPSADVINRVPLLSASRLSLEAFPAFMIAGRLGRSRAFDKIFTFVCLPLQGLWMTHFLLFHFIG